MVKISGILQCVMENLLNSKHFSCQFWDQCPVAILRWDCICSWQNYGNGFSCTSPIHEHCTYMLGISGISLSCMHRCAIIHYAALKTIVMYIKFSSKKMHSKFQKICR